MFDQVAAEMPVFFWDAVFDSIHRSWWNMARKSKPCAHTCMLNFVQIGEGWWGQERQSWRFSKNAVFGVFGFLSLSFVFSFFPLPFSFPAPPLPCPSLFCPFPYPFFPSLSLPSHPFSFPLLHSSLPFLLFPFLRPFLLSLSFPSSHSRSVSPFP